MGFRANTFLSLSVICLLIFPSYAQPKPAPVPEAGSYEALAVELADAYEKWLKHRKQKIAVLDIKGLAQVGGVKDEEAQLVQRLETLQNKKISNREWHEYWQTEAVLARRIVSLYEQLAPEKGASPLLEEQRVKSRLAEAAAIKQRSTEDSFTQASNAKDDAEKAVRAIMNSLTEARQANQLSIDGLKETRAQQLKGIEQLKQELTSETDAERKAQLQLNIEKANQAYAKANQAYDETSAKARIQTKIQQTINDLLAGNSVPQDDLPKSEQAAIALYLKTRSVLETAQAQREAAQQAAVQLESESEQAKLNIARYRNRRPALNKWAELSDRKVKNQDVYYAAIQADINAVNLRLRGLKKPRKDADVDDGEDACKPSLTSKLTPYARHRACVESMRKALDQLDEEQEQTEQKAALTQKLNASVEELMKAQVTDESLVELELSIAQSENERVQSLKTEAKPWKSVWQYSVERATTKREQLSEAVLVSRQSQRTLKAKLGVYRDTTKRISEQKDTAKAKLKDASSFAKTITSVGETAWQIVQVGWPALIYLLIAFILVRLIRRYRTRSEQLAIEAQEGRGTEELTALKAELEAAMAADDEAREMELHDEIGKLENRIQDEGQRIATIARVASQALSLIIYIATTLLVLDALTVDIKPILGGAAIFGLAISFGSQSLVKDVVSGFFILLENQYAVGDVVSINGKSGTVEQITLRRTVLRDGKGAVHNITNGSVSSVTNSTQGWSRVIIHIGVAYGTDLALVEQVINEVGEEMYDDSRWTGKLTEKPSFVGVTALGESDVQVRAWFKTKTFQNWGAEREFNRRILEAFNKAGIEIPFPSRTLFLTKPMDGDNG
ncbi:MAG: mechanosensitive ion channel domain-containing protein [Myxococcota bacterium]|nr:mechanosensitive ion channel domain-containing protein [Myxococcota bacterium]